MSNTYIGCKAYGNGGDGFRFENTTGTMIGCESIGNGGHGFNSIRTVPVTQRMIQVYENLTSSEKKSLSTLKVGINHGRVSFPKGVLQNAYSVLGSALTANILSFLALLATQAS